MGVNTLSFLERSQGPNERFDQKEVTEKLGWLKEFKNPLEQWDELVGIVATTESFVREQGIFQDCHIPIRAYVR